MAPTLNLTTAYTTHINPSGATPVLKRETIFAGLKHKVRDATAFVPIIVHCEVVKEEGTAVTREIRFKDGTGPPGLIKEVCVEHEPTKVRKSHFPAAKSASVETSMYRSTSSNPTAQQSPTSSPTAPAANRRICT